MTEQLGDQPIEPKYIEEMNRLASFLDHYFNGNAKGKDRKVGFALLIFEYGEQQGRCNYISNGANRRDMAVLLEEQAKRFRETI